MTTSEYRPNGKSRQALLLDAAIDGLVTARALADHVDRVIVVEQDRLATGHLRRTERPGRSVGSIL